VIWMKKLMVMWCAALVVQGCNKKQQDVQIRPKPQEHAQIPPAIQQTGAQGALPPRLLTAVAENFPQYHVPAGIDLTGLWAKAVQEGSLPFLCHGDFNGDGLDDYAIVLIAQNNWRFVIFEQRPGGEFLPGYIARPHLPAELPKAGENTSIEAPQELILEKLAKGQVWAPEAGDEPYEVKLQTDGIILHDRKKLRYADLDATTLVSFANGRFRQDNFAELLIPIEKP
jgi:hypothetical protein